MSVSSPAIKLPACERCRKSKTRCDSAVPKCSGCIKGNTACIIVDTSTGERYARDQLHSMQQRLDMLEARESERSSVTTASGFSPATATPVRRSHYVGDGSGSDMFHRVSVSASTAEARAKVVEQLKRCPTTNEPFTSYHELPSYQLATKLIDRYCSHAQLLHPLLSKADIRSTFDRVYTAPEGHAEKQDLYTIFMISAISSVTMFRSGDITEHPYGFYRSATRLTPDIAMVGSVQAVQNLLLIARFAMYYHIECSIWDIIRSCIRQCIELGLHEPPSKPLPLQEEQLRRNVFWDCYVHDRYSSGILGRPFAISEEDIEVQLPLEAGEEQLLASSCVLLDQVDLAQLATPNEASIFNFVIRLRRITAHAQARFFSPRSLYLPRPRTFMSAGEILRDLDSFMSQLDQCQFYAPSFFEAHSLYERPEWHQFMVEKDRLTVIRGALSNLSLCGSHLPRKLLVLCLKCATGVVELYFSLFLTGSITWTRSYFQILFTSGMSTIYVLSQLKTSTHDAELSDKFESASQALVTCSELLSQFANEMPDSARFAEVFEALSRPYITKNRYTSQQNPDDMDRAGHQNSLHTNRPMNVNQDLRAATMNLSDSYAPDFASFDLDGIAMEDWSLFPTTTNTFLGQMEAGIGEYAWGAQHDANAWQQYFSR